MALRDPIRRYGFTAVGLVLLLAGLGLLSMNGWMQPRSATSFGWFAYAPLGQPQHYADYLPVQRSGVNWWVIGLGLATLGLISTAGGIGYLLGRRVSSRGASEWPAAPSR